MFEQLLLGVYYDIIIELNLNIPYFSWKKNKKMQNFTFDFFFLSAKILRFCSCSFRDIVFGKL